MPNTPGAREPARRGALMRRAAALAPLPPNPVSKAVADPALAIGEHCQALTAAQDRLVKAWQAREAWLIKQRDWHQLSELQQAGIPEGRDLRSIQDELVEVDQAFDRQLLQLTRTSARTRDGVMAKIDVLLSLPSVGNDPDAGTLLESCRADLEQLWRPRRRSRELRCCGPSVISALLARLKRSDRPGRR